MPAAIGIQIRRHQSGANIQHRGSDRGLDSLEIHRVAKCLRTQQAFDLLRRRGDERTGEWLLVCDRVSSRRCCSRNSHSVSFHSVNCLTRSMKRWYSATWRRVSSSADLGMPRHRVFESTMRVSCHPGWPGCAQWQLGLPHFRWYGARVPGRKYPIEAN